MPLPLFQWLYGKPNCSAILKQTPEDFIVNEQLGFEFSGEGEHVCLQVQKRNCNTPIVADALATWANVPRKLVSYAGLKDRHALTTQWFSVQLPGKEAPSVDTFDLPDARILTTTRHNKKIKTGALQGNWFDICLKSLDNPEGLEQKLTLIKQQGVPNYFGEQRFGIEGNNLFHAKSLFNGRPVRSKTKRGLYLSAARSLLFNLVVSGRIEKSLFSELIDGELLQLAGSNSFFSAESSNAELQQRLANHEINITAPLWGRSKTAQQLPTPRQQLETELLAQHSDFCSGLEKAGLDMARRSIRLIPHHFQFQLEGDQLRLQFFLRSGSYATSVIRELVNVHSPIPLLNPAQ